MRRSLIRTGRSLGACSRSAAAAILLAALLAGCTYTGFAVDAVQQQEALSTPADLQYPAYRSVDWMVRQLHREPDYVLKGHMPVVVGSIADIADVNHSTPLGNAIADLVRSRLVQHGIPVIDMRLRSAVQLSPSQGELALSRNRHQVYPPPAAGIICAGTYAVARATVFVSLKMMNATNAEILAAADFSLPLSYDVQGLLVGPEPAPESRQYP